MTVTQQPIGQQANRRMGVPDSSPYTMVIHSVYNRKVSTVFNSIIYWFVGADAQRSVADPRVQKELGADKPLLQVCSPAKSETRPDHYNITIN